MKNLFLFLLVALVTGCTAEKSFTGPVPPLHPLIEVDREVLRPPSGYSTFTRTPNDDLMVASKGRGRGKQNKPPKDTSVYEPPTDTTSNPPPTSPYRKVVYLNFAGGYNRDIYWSVGEYAYSGMTAEWIDSTVSRVTRAFAKYDVYVTDDSLVYAQADATSRIQCNITESWSWYGQAGGVAYVGSFKWQDAHNACWVFSSLLGYGKTVSDAAIHEIGHTLGLRHQAKWEWVNGVWTKTSDYRTDGYWMGAAYYVVFGFWGVGLDSFGNTQDDEYLLILAIGLKKIG